MQTIKFFAILVAAATEMAAESAPSRRLLVNIPARKIALLQDGKVVKIFSVAVGKQSTPSPSGSFHIASHVVNPTWSHGGKVVGPGPSNPVGTRWMSIGYKGYGIHGTNRPESIGHAASHGCIRMRNHDVEELFDLVRVGDPVDLIADPTPEETSLFEELAQNGARPAVHSETTGSRALANIDSKKTARVAREKVPDTLDAARRTLCAFEAAPGKLRADRLQASALAADKTTVGGLQ